MWFYFSLLYYNIAPPLLPRELLCSIMLPTESSLQVQTNSSQTWSGFFSGMEEFHIHVVGHPANRCPLAVVCCPWHFKQVGERSVWHWLSAAKDVQTVETRKKHQRHRFLIISNPHYKKSWCKAGTVLLVFHAIKNAHLLSKTLLSVVDKTQSAQYRIYKILTLRLYFPCSTS